MAPDDFKNLGFAEDAGVEDIRGHAEAATTHKSRDNGKTIT